MWVVWVESGWRWGREREMTVWDGGRKRDGDGDGNGDESGKGRG